MKYEHPIVWFEIYVNDLNRAKAFYEQVFNIRLTNISDPVNEAFQMLTFSEDPESNKISGALVKANGMQAGGNSTIVYFGSEDCSVEQARVKEAGGSILRPKMSIGEHGYVSLINDTEGNIIGIHSKK